MNTEQLADEIESSIIFIKYAHISQPKSPEDKVRFHDLKTPYIVHPIWCAMTLLSETTLDESIRFIGYQALLFHDVLEDTKAVLPDKINYDVRELVKSMSFASFQEEKQKIWQSSNLIRLLKLYDKTSNLLDGSHMNNQKWNTYVEFVLALTEDVEANFGQLNIVRMAKAIAIYK